MRKAVKISLIGMAALITGLASVLLYFSQKNHTAAHQKIVEYLNREFGDQVSFSDFSLSYIRSFPKIHVEVLDLVVYDGQEELLRSGDVDILLNLSSSWKKKLKIDRLVISDLVLNQVTDSLKASEKLPGQRVASGESSQSSFIFESRHIEIRNALLCFNNKIKHNRSYIRIDHAKLKLRTNDSLFIFTGHLDGNLDSLISNNSPLFVNQPVRAEDISFRINRHTGVKVLESGKLIAHTLVLTPRLQLTPHMGGQLIDLEISGEDDFDGLMGLFELHLGIDLKQSNTGAKLDLLFKQHGFVNAYNRAYSELDFRITDAVFEGADLPFPVELIYAKGNYNNGEKHSPETTNLLIDSLYAEVSDSHIGGHFRMTNLKDPIVDASVVSSLDLAHLVRENEDIRLTGKIDLKLSMNGKLSELRKLHIEGKQSASAEIQIENLDLLVKQKGYSIQLASGTTVLNNHFIEISAVVGAFNRSAFHFNGHIENLDQFLLNKNEMLTGKIFLNFKELDLTKIDIAGTENNPSGNSSGMAFEQVALELIANGDKIITPIGELKNISASVLLRDDLLSVSRLGFDFQEGHVESTGEIRFNENGIAQADLKINGNFRNLDLDFPGAGPDQGEPAKNKSGFPEFIHADLSLTVDKGTIQDIPLKKLSVEAGLKGQEISLERFRVEVFDGQISASGNIAFDSTGLAGIRIISKMDFNHFKPESIIDQLGLSGSGSNRGNSPALPQQVDIRLDFNAVKLTYKDLVLSNSGFSAHADRNTLTVSNLQSDLPFGQIEMDLAVQDFTSQKARYEGDISLAIGSLSISDLLEKEYIKEITGSASKPSSEKDEPRKEAELPENIDLTFILTADRLQYDNLVVSGVELDLSYDETGLNLERLDLGFAKGKIHADGKLKKDASGAYPGYLYLQTHDLDLRTILGSFDDFDQDAFTSQNSSGKISSASHHYFRMGKDLEFVRNSNFWLGNVMIHHAEFDGVQPIVKSLSFVGHKAKDTMIVSELDVNILLARDRLYFRNLLMNDNIANLALSGEVHLDAYEMDLWAEISLSDLLYRSKQQRKEETEAGIMTLDKDSRLYLRMFGPLSDHKLKLENEKKYGNHLEDLSNDISTAQDGFRKSASSLQWQADE